MTSPTIVRLSRIIYAATTPQLVLDLGSGASTIWAARALEKSQTTGKVISVDHSSFYLEKTKSTAHDLGLNQIIEFRLAPLKPVCIGEQSYDWYDLTAFEDLDCINTLIIDGPPAPSSPKARFPALPILSGKLAAGASICFDDFARPDEIEILEEWMQSYPGLLQIEEVGKALFLKWTDSDNV